MATPRANLSNLEIVEELARRFQTGGVQSAFALYHPALRIEQPASLPHGGVHRGHDGIRAMGATFARFWDRTISHPRRMACLDGGVVQITTQTWTAKSTGREATVDVVELFAFADQLITEIRVFQHDTHLLLTTLDADEPATERCGPGPDDLRAIDGTPTQKPAPPAALGTPSSPRSDLRLEGPSSAIDRILLANAQILTCSGNTGERPFNGDILIEGQRIACVARGRIHMDSAFARQIDLKGATLLPGLGDAHVHMSWPLDFVFAHAAVATAPPATHALDVAAVARTFLESGYTLVVGAGVLQAQDDLLVKDAVDRGLLPGPRVVPSGLMITERGRLGSDSGLMEVVANAQQMREVVARQCGSGVLALKLFISGDGAVPAFPSEDTYMNDAMLEAAVAEAERHGAFVTVHARSTESIAMAARTGVRIIHHACFLDDSALRALQSRDDLWVCPGLHYLYAMVHGHAASWGMTAKDVAAFGYPRELEAQVEGLRRMRSAGIRLVSGGDFGHQWTRHGTYAAELQRYVELVDMTPTEAILTATRNFGPLVGLKCGQIAEGYLADMLVIDGDPTTDITVLQSPSQRRAVIKDGRLVYLNPVLFP